MKVWTCNSFEGHYPVGVAAVIVAPTRHEACERLREELARIGLPQELSEEQVVRFRASEQIRILDDGDY